MVSNSRAPWSSARVGHQGLVDRARVQAQLFGCLDTVPLVHVVRVVMILVDGEGNPQTLQLGHGRSRGIRIRPLLLAHDSMLRY